MTPRTQLWLMLYVNAAVLQVAVYFWNRKYNVSPHEEEGSSGVSGMVISVMSTPLYVSALWAAIRNRSTGFAVTRKGAVSGDRPGSFTRHLLWAAVLLAALTASQLLGHTHALIRFWAVLSLVMCLLPVANWATAEARQRLRAPERTPAPPVPDALAPVRPRTPAVTFVGNRAIDVPVDVRQTQESPR